VNLLPLWLTNDTVPLLVRGGDVARDAASTELFLP
jgi:hypothetical protein